MAHQRVYDAFMTSAARRPTADFLHVESVTARHYGLAAGAISWEEAQRRVAVWCSAYRAAGYGHGHRVGLMLENRPDFFFHWLALNALGVSVVPMSTDMRTAELVYLMTHAELCLVVCLDDHRDVLQASAKEADHALAVFAPADMGGKGIERQGIEWQAPTVPAAMVPAPCASEPMGPGTECALLYTSGTTGQPKGCVLDNAYFLRAGHWYASLEGVCAFRQDEERIMTPLPLNHVNAMAFSAMAVLVGGGCLIQLDRFHPRSWLDSARESEASIVHYLGVMPAMLLSAPAEASDRDHAIRWGFGAGVLPDHHAAFEARFGFPLVEAWAMTETGAAACIMANHEPRQVGTHCFGRPEAFVECRLVDEAGVDVPPGEPGELLVRANGTAPRQDFFRAYLKDEAATEAVWRDGWFHTGDIVLEDDTGHLHFVDRKKNVIRRSGENVSALEVETVLNRHPAIRSSAVAPTPDALRGDEVMACVILNEDFSAQTEAARKALAEDIVQHVLSQLAYFKAPGHVAFVGQLPITSSQKVQRAELKKLAASLPGQANCIDTRHLKTRRAG